MFRASLLIFTSFFCLHAASAETAVIIQSSAALAPSAWDAMEREAARIAQKAGIRLRFLTHSQAGGKEFDDLVVFRMKGNCRIDALPAASAARGPLASAMVSGSRVLPFGEVNCDRLRESLRSAMGGSDLIRADALYGRALGRVIAHEIYHMVSNSREHAESGIARAAISARQLLSEELNFDDGACHAIRENRIAMLSNRATTPAAHSLH